MGLDSLLTPEQVAKMLKISAVSVRLLCKAGKMDHARVGLHEGRILIARESVEEYLERSRKPISEAIPQAPRVVPPVGELQVLKV
jgi:excisionase family DNA binding protein